MKLLTSLSECDWIIDGTVGHKNGTVAHCLPSIYPAYAKIFHPIYEDLSVQDDEVTWQAEEKAKPPGPQPKTETERILMKMLADCTLVYGGARPGARLVRIRWAELSRRLGLAFKPTFSAATFTRQFPGGRWPRYLVGPAEGDLIGPGRDALLSVLRNHTNVSRILYRFWLLATTDWTDEKVFEGLLEEAILFPDKNLGVRSAPTYWFPEDRRWLVCSNYDLTFTLIGGSQPLIQDLLDHPTLECVPVLPNTRIDWSADLDPAVH